jgi:hypothetical protein
MNRLARLIPVLLLAVAFFGWETYRAWVEPSSAETPPGTEDGGVGGAPDNAAEPPSTADPSAAVAQIVARPLLRPDRLPFKEVPFLAAKPQRNYEAEMARFSVVGILPIDGIVRALVVAKGASGRDERYEVAAGDSLPGFVVRAVRADGILLEADGKEMLLPLYAGGPKGAGAPARTEIPQGAAHGVLPAMPVPGAFPRGALPASLPPPSPAPSYVQPETGRPREPGNVRFRARQLPPRPVSGAATE